MEYTLIKEEEFQTTNWAGGTTTELYIHPKNAQFSSRQFDFRLSIATINIEESDFTPLPGINRTLLLLDGRLELIHKNHHRSTLTPFKQDSFLGDWQTKCSGTGRDFNLMTQNYNGAVKVIDKDTTINSITNYTCLYALEEEMFVNEIHVPSGSLMVISNGNNIEILTKGKAICVELTTLNIE